MRNLVVIGQGYVGLPLALQAAQHGFSVIGLDTNTTLVEALNAGWSHIDDISHDQVKSAVVAGYSASTDPRRVADADVVVVCVPTPLSTDGGPDLTAVEGAARDVANYVEPNTLVILESTSYPGTTEDIFAPLVLRSGLKLGTNINRPIKRAFVFTLAGLVLVLTMAIQLTTALAIRIRLGRPVLFWHTRPGLHGEPFEMVKFRTMLNVKPAQGLMDDASRMTPLGLWLRATSLDELPSLWNVIRGDLSLVGPRPLICEYLGRYSPEQATRHDVRPGVTGLAQVSGRNALSWEDKFFLDVYYVDHRTFLGDLKILLQTVVDVARREGISEPGETTSSEFLGTADHGDRT